MKQKPVFWFVGFILLTGVALGLIAANIIHIDPFFHYHKPETNEYFYSLNNQRSQNDGIVKNFDYNGLITGTSMTENFSNSEAENLWGCSFVKVPYSGGTYKEIDGIIETALKYNPDLKYVIRGLDMDMFFVDKDRMRTDLGEYPTYLYDDDLLNDVHYLFNRDVIFSRAYPMMKARTENGFTPGITSFDQYSNWMKGQKFGKNVLFPDGITVKKAADPVHITGKQTITVQKNVVQNVAVLASYYPDVTFYYFFPPYSAQWWKSLAESGTIYRQIEAERLMIETILERRNIKLFSFNNRFDITTDLNNYKDSIHYGEWVNSLMLQCMHDEQYMLTRDNYEAYLDEELQFYTSFNYALIKDQPDYENDLNAAFLLTKEKKGANGAEIDLADDHLELRNAELVKDQHGGKDGILCKGSLGRDYHNTEITVADYLRDTEYIGFKMEVKDITPYNYLIFYGRKVNDHGQPIVCIYDREGHVIGQHMYSYHDINYEWKQYIINVSKLTGEVYIIFNGGYEDSTGSAESKYVFSDIRFY